MLHHFVRHSFYIVSQKCSITPEKGMEFTRAQEIGDKRRKSVMSDEGGKVEKEK
jgi:hypothetical protein